MKPSMLIKGACGLLALGLFVYFGFTTTLSEGQKALITRFGAPRAELKEAGLYWRLPWPFEEVHSFEARRHSLDSGLTETLTGDKKNIVLQTALIWQIAEPALFFTAVGDEARAEELLSDLATDAKNSLLGRYPLDSLLSLDGSQLKLDEIEAALTEAVASRAKTYGLVVPSVQIKRIAFPSANLAAVLDQMAAERNTQVVQLNAQGARDASALRGKADVEAARLRAQGQKDAAAVRAESEKEVARIYAEAWKKNPSLYTFLTKLRVLEHSIDGDTVLVMPSNESPFDALKGPKE